MEPLEEIQHLPISTVRGMLSEIVALVCHCPDGPFSSELGYQIIQILSAHGLYFDPDWAGRAQLVLSKLCDYPITPTSHKVMEEALKQAYAAGRARGRNDAG